MLEFVIWMICWPIGCDIARSYRMKCLGDKYSERYSDQVVGVAALVEAIIWIWIAILIYPK